MDGVGPVILESVFKNKLNFIDVITCNYGFENNPEVMNYLNTFDDIVIVDLSLPEESVKTWIDKGITFRIYDHHSETQWITEYENSVWDDNRCGTKIFWEEYVKPIIGRYSPIIDSFITLVDTYDRWQQNSDLWEDAKNLNNILYGMKAYDKTTTYEQLMPFIDLMAKKFIKLDEWRWTDKELKIIERSNKRESDLLETALSQLSVRTDSKDKIFGICMLPSKISLVASEVLRIEENLDYLIVINSYRGVNGKLSFRSRNGFNCNDIFIAKGHDAAAGAVLEIKDVIRLWEDESLSFKYNEEIVDEKDIFNKTLIEV